MELLIGLPSLILILITVAWLAISRRNSRQTFKRDDLKTKPPTTFGRVYTDNG